MFRISTRVCLVCYYLCKKVGEIRVYMLYTWGVLSGGEKQRARCHIATEGSFKHSAGWEKEETEWDL